MISKMATRALAFVVLSSVMLIASPAMACSASPLATPTADERNLDDDASQWGVYCGNDVAWALTNTVDPASEAMLLDLSVLSGEPYGYVHAYRHLIGEPDANDFTLKMRFNFSPANEGPSTAVHAMQFGMESWANERRYEMSLEWVNRDGNGSQWRFWNGQQWIDTGITQDLAADTWHTLTVHGTITSQGNVRYDSFKIDGTMHKLRIEAPSVAAAGEADRLAVTTTLVGNFETAPFDVFLDDVDLTRKTMKAVVTDGPGSGKKLKAKK